MSRKRRTGGPDKVFQGDAELSLVKGPVVRWDGGHSTLEHTKTHPVGLADKETASSARGPTMRDPLFVPEPAGTLAPTAQEVYDAEREADEEWHLVQSAQEMDAEAGWLRAAENNYFTPEEGGY